MRIAIIMNMIAPYTTEVFERIARRPDCELLVLYETVMEPSRHWQPQANLPYRHAVLHSWTLDLARLAVGSGFKTREDTYLYIAKRPLAPLSRFAPDVVIAAGGGIWSSPTNIAALAARAWRGWAFVPWWGSFLRAKPTLPRRLADPWVRTFIRSGDAWMAYGTRSSADLVRLGADPARIVIAPLVATPASALFDASRGPEPPGQPLRYLFVGRLIERKGIDVLLDAFREVRGGELWVAGDGPLADRVERAAEDDERVRVLGHAGAAQLDDLYSRADVLVLPSHYDVWGLVVNEAQAYGLPVIATDQVGAAADLIEPGVNGFVVPAGSSPALARALNEVARWTPYERDRCAERCRAKLAERSLDRAAEAVFEASVLALEYHRWRSSRARRGGSPVGDYFRRRKT
jgi:glycosyltransferase involved in cell wall biosynthesis